MFAVLFVAAGCDPGGKTDHFKLAEEYYLQGAHRRAADTYLKYLAENPQGDRREDALFLCGKILYYTVGEKAEAVQVFGRLISLYPAGEPAYQAREIMAGAFRDEVRDYDRAIMEYTWLIRQRPKGKKAPKYQFQVARCYLLKKDLERAVIEFGRLVEQYPETELLPRVYDELAGIYLVLGRSEQAHFIYRSLMKRFPDSPLCLEAEFKIGTALEDMFRYKEALEVYQGLLERYPNRRAVELRIAGVKDRKKDRLGKVKPVDYGYRPKMAGDNLKNFDEKKKQALQAQPPKGKKGVPKIKGLDIQSRKKKEGSE